MNDLRVYVFIGQTWKTKVRVQLTRYYCSKSDLNIDDCNDF